MEVDYYAKYLKYKNKYIELKEQMGGAVIKGVKCDDKNVKQYFKMEHILNLF